MASLKLLLIFATVHLLSSWQLASGQFPTICNTESNIRDKICCPDNCGSSRGRGICMNIKNKAMEQASNSDRAIVNKLAEAKNITYKATIDSRHLWPTMVFEQVCNCTGNYYGADCSECKFGWTGDDCMTKKKVIRKSFGSLTGEEKQQVINGLRILKQERGYWSVIISEPRTETGRVQLEDVTTYDYLVYIHNFVARDASKACKVNNGLPMDINIDFAHSGPNFLVWHRTYMLIVERAMQRVLNDPNFGFPYWKWESNDDRELHTNLFSETYFGRPSLTKGQNENINNGLPGENWRTVCDSTYREGDYFTNQTVAKCQLFWKLCNPNHDLQSNGKLKRGNAETYLPSLKEIQIAMASEKYDVPDSDNKYGQKSPIESFRSALEGWSLICSASNCRLPQVSDVYQRLHNNVHDWIAGHMSVPPSAVNDPIFSLHHCNVDRILESWMQRFSELPSYVPNGGGHPGHNKDDFMVPFFPLITPGEQYAIAENWGYEYGADNSDLVQYDSQLNVENCPFNEAEVDEKCYICHANTDCYHREKNELTGAVNYMVAMNCSEEQKNRCKGTIPSSSSSKPMVTPSSGSSKVTVSQHLLLVFNTLAFMVGPWVTT